MPVSEEQIRPVIMAVAGSLSVGCWAIVPGITDNRIQVGVKLNRIGRSIRPAVTDCNHVGGSYECTRFNRSATEIAAHAQLPTLAQSPIVIAYRKESAAAATAAG